MLNDNNKRIIITGGPGSGKSTLIHHLHSKGFNTITEAGRSIIRDQTIIGGNALPWRDKVAFSELMLNWELRSWHLAVDSKHPYFFDRGIPDIAGYLTTCDIHIPKHIEKAISLFRYARTVFIAPPWEDIFVQDAERKQSYKESVKTFDAMVECYTRYKYELVELPCVQVEERARFILASLNGDIYKMEIS